MAGIAEFSPKICTTNEEVRSQNKCVVLQMNMLYYELITVYYNGIFMIQNNDVVAQMIIL